LLINRYFFEGVSKARKV